LFAAGSSRCLYWTPSPTATAPTLQVTAVPLGFYTDIYFAANSEEIRAIRTYVKNSLSRNRTTDLAYIRSRYIFIQDSEAARSHTETFGFYERAFTPNRRDHNSQLSTRLLALDERGHYAFVRHHLFQHAVRSFINYRQLEGKFDLHCIQTYVGTMVSNTLYFWWPLLTQ